MRRLLLFLPLLLCLLLPLGAQQQRIFDPDVRTLSVIVDGDPLLPPMLARQSQMRSAPRKPISTINLIFTN